LTLLRLRSWGLDVQSLKSRAASASGSLRLGCSSSSSTLPQPSRNILSRFVSTSTHTPPPTISPHHARVYTQSTTPIISVWISRVQHHLHAYIRRQLALHLEDGGGDVMVDSASDVFIHRSRMCTRRHPPQPGITIDAARCVAPPLACTTQLAWNNCWLMVQRPISLLHLDFIAGGKLRCR
jgi:hypothetical protein